MLIAVAQRLSASLRPADTVARLGGDEFVAILPGLTHVQDAERRVFEALTLPVSKSDRVPSDALRLWHVLRDSDNQRRERTGDPEVQVFQHPSQNLTLIYRPAGNHLLASDHGGGFARPAAK